MSGKNCGTYVGAGGCIYVAVYIFLRSCNLFHTQVTYSNHSSTRGTLVGPVTILTESHLKEMNIVNIYF